MSIPALWAKKAIPLPGREQQVSGGLFLQSNNPVAGGARHGGKRALAPLCRCHPRECTLLDGNICVQIDVRGFDLLVAQP